tara:strand:- start:561 stop:1457 length:897 start_codon:yes stop_codon:yes gene_type:complete
MTRNDQILLILIFFYSIIFSFYCAVDTSSLDFSRLLHRFELNDNLPDWGAYPLLDALIFVGNTLMLSARYFYWIIIFIVLFTSMFVIKNFVGQKSFFLFVIMFSTLIPPSDFVHLLKQNLSVLFFLIALLTMKRISRLVAFLCAVGMHLYIVLFAFLLWFRRSAFLLKNSTVITVFMIFTAFSFSQFQTIQAAFNIIQSFGVPLLSARVHEYRVDRWGDINTTKISMLAICVCTLYIYGKSKIKNTLVHLIVIYCSVGLMFASLFTGFDILVYRFLVYIKIPAIIGLSLVLRPTAWRF